MFSETITPRFSDTDALGHINNTMLPIWFEAARNPVFRLFNPSMDVKKWNLILANIEVSFSAQLYYEQPIEIRTFIKRIGGSSFIIYQQAWQQEKLCASGHATMVYFDYKQQKSQPITEDIRAQLELHLWQE